MRDRLLGQKRLVRAGQSNSWKAEEVYQREPAAPEEIAHLLHSAEHDLEGARDEEKAETDRRRSAYWAAVRLAAVVLRASGYRTCRALDDQGVLGALADLFGAEGRIFSEDSSRLKTPRGWRSGGAARWIPKLTAFRESVLEWLALKHASLLPRTPENRSGPDSHQRAR